MARKPMQLNDAQRKLVEDNIGLVVYTLRREFGDAYANDDDNVAEGMYALCRAAACFDAGAGTKFSVYAYRAIKNWMHVIARNAGMQKRKTGHKILSLDAQIRSRSDKSGETIGDHLKDHKPGPDVIAENTINAELYGNLLRRISAECPLVVGAMRADKKSAYFQRIAIEQSVTRQAVSARYKTQHRRLREKYIAEYKKLMYGDEKKKEG